MDENWKERDVVEGQGPSVRGNGYDEDGLGHGVGWEEILNKMIGMEERHSV
jgi:hypothetical protein